MASFRAKLTIGNFKTNLDSFVLEIHQQIDSLGRPASPTFGGTICMAFDTPTDPLVSKWMFDPAMQKSGVVVLRDLVGRTMKEIHFTGAFCVAQDIDFDAYSSAKLTTTITVSPEKITVSDMKHDNSWAPIEGTS